MPRKGAKGKWNLKMSPDEWYSKPDPFNIFCSYEEDNKASIICSLLDYGGTGMDVGCGEGLFTERYTHMKDFIGMDISHIAIGRAKGRRHRAAYLQGDITFDYKNKEKVDTII